MSYTVCPKCKSAKVSKIEVKRRQRTKEDNKRAFIWLSVMIILFIAFVFCVFRSLGIPAIILLLILICLVRFYQSNENKLNKAKQEVWHCQDCGYNFNIDI